MDCGSRAPRAVGKDGEGHSEESGGTPVTTVLGAESKNLRSSRPALTF